MLTVTVVNTPAAIAGAAGTTPGLQYSATIITSAGLEDAAGNRLSLTGDVTVG